MFRDWQPKYAAHGIATFPVEIIDGKKKPAIQNFMKVGLAGSAALAEKFPDAMGIGFVTGRKSRITVVDIDCEHMPTVSAEITRHGPTPIQVKTGKGYHLWYRYNGEPRLIRPERDRAVDILGDNGMVTAPWSRTASGGQYHFLGDGALEWLDKLRVSRIAAAIKADSNVVSIGLDERRAMRAGDDRNNHLFRLVGQAAHCVDDRDALLDFARTRNEEFDEPLPDAEVIAITDSVWRYQKAGMNRFGQHGAWLPAVAVDELVGDPHLLALIAWLRRHNRPDSAGFWVADGAAELLGWPRRQFANARKLAVERGLIKKIRGHAPGRPALYQWASGIKRWTETGRTQRTEPLSVEDYLSDSAGLAA
jgi:hypothetical protein